MAEVLEFDSMDDAQAVAFGWDDDFEVIEDEIVDHSRWSVGHSVVVKRVSDGKFFVSSYSRGATENQDESPYEYDDRKFYEAEPFEKTVIEYRFVK